MGLPWTWRPPPGLSPAAAARGPESISSGRATWGAPWCCLPSAGGASRPRAVGFGSHTVRRGHGAQAGGKASEMRRARAALQAGNRKSCAGFRCPLRAVGLRAPGVAVVLIVAGTRRLFWRGPQTTPVTHRRVVFAEPGSRVRESLPTGPSGFALLTAGMNVGDQTHLSGDSGTDRPEGGRMSRRYLPGRSLL